MHKKLLISSILFFFTILTLNSQELVSTDPMPRNAVLEEFTGIYCGFCPEGHIIAQGLKDANPGRVVLINIHEGSYAVPKSGSGHPDFRSPWGAAPLSMSKLVGFPGGMMNRQLFVGSKYQQQDPANNSLALSRGGWAAAAADIFADANSPVNIGAKVERIPGNKLKISVELYYTADAGQANKLNVVLLENGYVGYQGGSKGGEEYVHNHILRDMVTGQWGEQISNTSKGTLITRSYEYEITNRVDPITSKLEIAIFVTKADNSNIYTGIDVEVPEIEPAIEIIKPEIVKSVKPQGEPYSNEISVKNISDSDLILNLSVAKSTRTPADWTAQLNSGTPAEITLAPGESFKPSFSITPGATIGFGDAILSIKEVNSQFQNVTTHTISCISQEISSIEVIAQSEISTRGLQKTLTKLGYPNFFEVQSADLAEFGSMMTNLKTVVWNYSATMSPATSDFTIINSLTEKGVNQFICGNLVSSFGATNLSKLGLEPLGYSTQGYGSSPWLVWLNGVSGDPITGGITSDIEGNLINYLINVYTVKNPATTFPFMTFKNTGKVVRTQVSPRDTVDLPGSEAQFGFRIQNTNSRTVFLSLCPYVIKQIPQRELILDNIMKWLNGINSVENGNSETADLLYPNPADDIITLKEAMVGQPFKVISSAGLTVQEGIYESHIKLENHPAGAYVLLIEGRTFRFIKK